MICDKCNAENPDGSRVCLNCGSKLTKKNKNRNFQKYGGLLAVVILCAAMFIVNSGILNKKYEYETSRAQYPIVYLKNNTLGIKQINKDKTILSDFLVENPTNMEQPKVFISKNGSCVYFLEGYNPETSTGALFAVFNGKTKVPVASRAYNNVQVSPDGKYALFVDLPNNGEDKGTLYIYKKNKDKTMISENVQVENFGFSKDGGSIAYIVNGELYYGKIDAEYEKVDSDVSKIIDISAFSGVVYMKNNPEYASDLYYWYKNKEAVKAGSRVSENLVFTSNISDSFYFCGDSNSATSSTLYYKSKNKPAKLIDTNVLSPIVWDCKYNNVIYTKNFSPDDYSVDTYMKMNGKNAVKLAASLESTRSPVQTTYNFKNTAYLCDIDAQTGLGKLYLKKTSFFSKEELMIAENVYDFKYSKDGSVLLYSEYSGGKYRLHRYKNRSDTVISEDICGECYKLAPDNSAVVYLSNYNADKNSGNLFLKKLRGGDSVKLDTEVTKDFYVRSAKMVVYTKNYSNDSGECDLNIWTGKKSENVDSGIISVLFEN